MSGPKCRPQSVLRTTLLLLILATPLLAQPAPAPIEARVDELLAQMTLAEKIGQLN